MTREYLTLGATPYDEECAQVGSEGYYARAIRECRAYLHQILRINGPAPAGADLRVKAFAHDFGTYHEVVAVYDPEASHEATEWAYKCESNTPARWDREAREELGLEDKQ